MSKPWKGPQYGLTRLLLLGESAYSWEGDDGTLRHPSSEHAGDLVQWVVDSFSTCEIPFMRMLSRGLANEHEPTKERLQFVWDRVAFINYVAGTVGFGPRLRPTEDMWEHAKQNFPMLLEDLRPRRIIVLGKTMWSRMPATDIHITDDVQGYRLSDGELVMCWAVNHPSRGLSWRQLASVIHFAYDRELRE